MKKINILVFCCLVSIAQAFNLFNKVQLNKTSGAMCMDGSNYALYTYLPDVDKPSNRLVLYFEEIWEGWCVKQDLSKSTERCYQYVNNSRLIDYGSSKNYPSDLFFLDGILALQGIFQDYYQVIIKSCDGGAYFGNASAKFKNTTLNFKGSKNIIESVNYLKKINFIQNRDQIVLVGIGNGGLAALAWSQYIKSQTKAKVKVLCDAAIWENEINDKSQDNIFQKRMETMGKLFINGGEFPNSKCQEAHKDNIQNCFYASELVKYIDSEIQIFFLQSYYDSWAIQQILGLDCTQQFGSLSECTQKHREAIQNYHLKIEEKMQSMVSLPNVGAFGISCVAHFFTNIKWDDENFSVPENKNNTAINVVSKWLANKSEKTYLDSQPWPHNKPCSRKVVLKLSLSRE